MSKLIEMPSTNGTIIVEVETAGDVIVPVNKAGDWVIQQVDRAFNTVETAVVDSCTILTDALKRLAEKEPALESASLECGFNFTGEGNIYLVKTAAEGSIKITLNLKLKQEQKSQK